jgi:hypothetical protein
VLLKLGGVRIKNVKILSKIDPKMKLLKFKEKLYYLDQLKLYVCLMNRNLLLEMKNVFTVEIKQRNKFFGVDLIDIKIILLIIFKALKTLKLISIMN